MKTILKPTFLFFVLVLLLFSVTANAESNAYMTIGGANQGEIHGDITLQGKEDTFEINEFHHLFEKDTAGRTTVHSLIVTTRMSKGMPSLLTAFNNFETLNSVVIRFYRQKVTGAEENHYTMTLTNAKLLMIEPIMLDNIDPANISIPTRFRMRFNYSQIEHTYINGESVTINNN